MERSYKVNLLDSYSLDNLYQSIISDEISQVLSLFSISSDVKRTLSRIVSMLVHYQLTLWSNLNTPGNSLYNLKFEGYKYNSGFKYYILKFLHIVRVIRFLRVCGLSMIIYLHSQALGEISTHCLSYRIGYSSSYMASIEVCLKESQDSSW